MSQSTHTTSSSAAFQQLHEVLERYLARRGAQEVLKFRHTEELRSLENAQEKEMEEFVNHCEKSIHTLEEEQEQEENRLEDDWETATEQLGSKHVEEEKHLRQRHRRELEEFYERWPIIRLPEMSETSHTEDQILTECRQAFLKLVQRDTALDEIHTRHGKELSNLCARQEVEEERLEVQWETTMEDLEETHEEDMDRLRSKFEREEKRLTRRQEADKDLLIRRQKTEYDAFEKQHAFISFSK